VYRDFDLITIHRRDKSNETTIPPFYKRLLTSNERRQTHYINLMTPRTDFSIETMASTAMNSTRDQRKHNQNGQSSLPKRDIPLFRSRQPLQQQDFFTDSLNSSFIPQPSPPKNAKGRGVGARPRRALGGPRTLKAAFEATADDTEEYRPQSSSSSDKNRPELEPKPRPMQTNGRAPAEKTEGQPHQLTPSPPRGKSAAIVSPQSSASSPPRGLAEAYQRIIDEEDLAAQEGESVDESTGDPHEYTYSADARERDRRLVERMKDPASPIILRSSRRGLPRASGRLEEIAVAEREAIETMHSMEGSEGDTSTNFLEDATDDSFGRRLMKHADDQRRVNSALKSEGQIFRKARVGERVGLTVENLRRSNGSHEALDMALNSGEKRSVNSDRSEPPVNIPRGWGRKGTGGKNWLSRIHPSSGRSRLTGDLPIVDKDNDPIITKAKDVEAMEEDIDWTTAAAEVPLPSLEDGSSPHVSVSRSSTPTSSTRRNTSLDKIRQWEMTEDDFTGRSLQISNSPPISIKNTTLDRIREREIETLERRAVTTSRLGELREKTSKEQLRRRSVSAPADEQQLSPERSREETERRLSTLSEDHHNHRRTIPEGEGEQVPNTPVTIYRGTKTSSERSSDGDDGHHGKYRRPSHQRQDSHGLLRQLARASSTSASPSPARDIRNKHDDPMSKTEDQERALADSGSERDDPHEERHQISENTSTSGSDRTPKSDPGMRSDATPQPIRQSLPLKTPLVTGAWIDTPLPTGGRGRGPPLPTPADLEDVRELTFDVDEIIPHLENRGITDRPSRSPSRGRTTEPNKQPPNNNNKPGTIKSALTAIVDEAQRGGLEREDDESPLGEDTIRSLEDLLADDTDVCTLLQLDDDDDADKSLQIHTSADGKPLTPNERERQTELLVLERMNGRLKALGLSIHDAKRGISKLAQQVCNEGGEFHDFIWPCEKCGCPGGRSDARLKAWRVTNAGDEGAWQIAIPVPRLWTWRTGERRPRLTWLGLFTLLAWAWVVAEYVACYFYCHPRYASSMVDYGVDITAPRAPFAAVTMFWRSPLGWVFKPFWYLLAFLVRFVARVLGYLDGFAGGGGGGGGWAGGVGGGRTGGWGGGNAVPRQPVSRDARIPRPVWGPDLSMMNDEFI